MKSKSLEFLPLEAGLKMDAKSKTLYGVQVAKLGEAKGHNFELDDVTLDKIVELGNAQPKGVKVRFGHPSMCTPALGTYMGVRKNFRRDGEYVRADLHMSEAADPVKAEHVMKMAQHAPHHIGNSVVVDGTEEFRVGDDGVRLMDEDGNELMPLLRVTSLKAVDVVDEPASGNGMFAEPIDGVELSAKTIIELRNAMDKPGFLERVSLFLGIQDSPVPVTADSDVSVEDVSMNLTLSELLEKHPAVAAEHAAKLSADKDKELAAAVESERANTIWLLGKCKPVHFSETKAFPKGFVLHAIENRLSREECLEALYDMNMKAVSMSALEESSSDIPVTSAEPVDKQLSVQEQAEASLMSAIANLKGGA